MTPFDVCLDILDQISDARLVILEHYPNAVSSKNMQLVDFLDAEKIRLQNLEDVQRNEMNLLLKKMQHETL